MKKERTLLLVISLLLVLIMPLALADMNLRITGEINNQTSDLWLKIKSGADENFDVYDMKAPTAPSNYSQFVSAVAGNSLSIDSWSTNPRTINLTYSMSAAQTGNVVFSWNSASIDTSSYDVKLKYYGSDSTYTTQVGSDVDMGSQSSYTTPALTSESDIYIQVVVSDVTTTTETTTSSGGGGGGGAAPSKIPIKGQDVFIGNKFMDAFMGLGSTRTRIINLFNQADTPILVKITPGTLGPGGGILIDDADLTFELAGRTSKTIEVTLVAPKKVGTYEGVIEVRGIAKQEIEVKVEVTKEELIFDAEIIVPWEYNIIGLDDDINVEVKLTPKAEEPRLDVRANYYVKDSLGKIIHESSDTFAVDGPWTKDLSFPIGNKNLEPGQYYVELDLEYPWPNPERVATSRYSFEIREGALVGGGLRALMNYRFVLFILGIGILVFLAIIVLVMIRSKKIRKKIKLK